MRQPGSWSSAVFTCCPASGLKARYERVAASSAAAQAAESVVRECSSASFIAPAREDGRGKLYARNTGPAPSAACETLPPVRRPKIEDRPERNDSRRVHPAVASVVVAFDVIEVDRLGDAGMLVEVAGVRPEIRVVGEPAEVALEVVVVHRVEADERREEPPVGFGEPIAAEVTPAREPFLEPVEGREERHDRLLVGFLRRRKAGSVDAVVERLVDAGVDRVDLRTERRRIVVAWRGVNRVERRIEHANDLGRLVADDRRVFAVLEDWYRHSSGVTRRRRLVHLVEVSRAVHAVRDHAGTGIERPAVLRVMPVDDRQPDEALEPFQPAKDERAVRPRTGERDVQVVAAGGGAETAFAGRSG